MDTNMKAAILLSSHLWLSFLVCLMSNTNRNFGKFASMQSNVYSVANFISADINDYDLPFDSANRPISNHKGKYCF